MIRVTFDRDYIDYLQDYYVRNECIREQQYLSQEKLLHLAAFCVSKAAMDMNDGGEPRLNANSEAALDVVRQLASLCATAVQPDGNSEPSMVVVGHTDGKRQDDEPQLATDVSATFVGKSILRMLRLKPAARSAKRSAIGEQKS